MSESLLMCSPDYYGILYEINPWMHVEQKADPKRAMKQWKDYYNLLTKSLGIKVELVEPLSNAPDMVFTANAGIVRGKTFVRSSFRYKERRKEEVPFERWFKSKGYILKYVPKPFSFEGEGDALSVGNTLYAGCHFRSNVESHEIVSEHLKMDFYSLELCDKRFYHLDTCFAPLTNELALAYLPAFEPYSQSLLAENFSDLIKVPEEEAVKFACNANVLGDQVVIPAECPKTKKALLSRGLQVHDLELDEFIKAGGAAKCMVLKI